MKNITVHEFLADWAEIYAKSRDAISKSIVSINKDKNNDLIIKHKDKEELYIISPFIEDIKSIIAKLDKEKIISLVLLNSKKNFDIIIDNWKSFVDLKTLKIVFVNPFSDTDKKWMINPYLHHKICDEDSLKTGLKSMFNTVVSTDEEKIKEKLKNQKEYI